jgi:RNA polymerase sigma-70 factor (ECF subfamily)
MGEVARIEEKRKASRMPEASKPIAFEEFFGAEKDRLLRAMSVITGSRTEAEDITQDAFLRLFERWETVATMDNPAGYLHRAAMNQFRSRHRRAAVALRRAVAIGPARDVFAELDDRDLAMRALGSLPPRQRAALVLTEALGYSGEEAGRLLGVQATTVWALTHQARAALATMEEPDG